MRVIQHLRCLYLENHRTSDYARFIENPTKVDVGLRKGFLRGDGPPLTRVQGLGSSRESLVYWTSSISTDSVSTNTSSLGTLNSSIPPTPQLTCKGSKH